MKKYVAIVCFVILFASFCLPVSANSRAQVWYGTDANGVIFKEGNVPIQVESELLTFDIPTLPYASYRDAQTFLAYDSKVTAEYTFYNPTDMTVTATLLFPFGAYPEYAKLYDSNSDKELYDEDLQRYGVYVNEERIEAKIRHTNYSGLDFDIEKQVNSMSDVFIEDAFYSHDLTVTKYSYEIVGQSLASAFFDITIKSPGSNRKVVLYNSNVGGYITNGGDVSIKSSSVKSSKKETIFFYVIGEPLAELPEAGWYKNNGSDPASRIDGEFSYLGSESMTFKDFVLGEYDADRGVSEVDWYNACVAEMKEAEESIGSTHLVRHLYFGSLMRWYEYEITLAPGEKIKNAVTAPMYPVIEAWDQPYEYHYTYLLSPASNWAEFGNLDIVINTPYEMSTSNLEGFEKTEGGYRLSRQGLPTNEEGFMDLSFTLLNDGNTPKEQPGPNAFIDFWENVFGAIGLFFTFIFMAIASFIKSIFN